MTENTKIQWATHSANAWRGCAKIASGCTHCYASTLANRFPAIFGTWGTERQGGVRVVANLPKLFSQVRKWDRQSYDKQCWYSTYTMHDPEKPRVFWNDVSDFFEPWQGHVHDRNGNAVRRCECGNPIFWPDFRCGCGGKERFATMADVRRMVFNVVDETPNLTHLFLTKRPENVRGMWPELSQRDGKEEWRVVGRHTGYQVSNFGRVRGPRGKMLAFSEKSEYPSVQLGSNANRWNVHILVAEAFIGPKPFPEAEVRHLDGNPWNNRSSNLKWGTRSENRDDSKRHGTHRRYCKLSPEQVSEIKRRAHLQSYASLGIEFGVSGTQIRNILNGLQWTSFQSDATSIHRANCWLLYSASDQATLDAGLPDLLTCRDLVPVLGLSLEPLIDAIDLAAFIGYNGEHENEKERNCCLQCGYQWRIGNRFAGPGVASGSQAREASRRISSGSMQEAKGRALGSSGICPSPSDGEREETSRFSTPTHLASPSRRDTGRPEYQSQKRGQGGQPPCEPRTGDAIGKCEARSECLESWAMRESVGRMESQRKSDRCPSCGNTATAIRRGTSYLDSQGLWRDVPDHIKNCTTSAPLISWCITGGESGPNARPCQIDWIRSIVEQCRETGVPCFVKQDFGPKPGLQGRIPDELWAVKELPHGAV